MSRLLIVLIALLSIVGCGDNAATPAANTDQTGKPSLGDRPNMQTTPGSDGGAVSMKAPEQKKTGTTTLAEASANAEIKPYPGSEKASGDVIDRGNGEMKDEITFETSDSVDKVNAFYKSQGLDAKNGPMAGSAMGMSKGGASIIVSYQKKGDKTQVSFKSVHAPKKP